ncbi:MAG: endopeptidase La [Fusobacteriaceae bacterium]
MSRLPFIPSRDMVVFPGIITPLYVGRTISVTTLERAMETKSKIILGMQKDPFEEIIDVEKGIYNVGVIANILQVIKGPNNTLKVLIEAENRVEISNLKLEDGEYVSSYKVLKVTNGDSTNFDALYRKMFKIFEKYGAVNGKVPAEVFLNLKTLKNNDIKLNIITNQLGITSEEKHKVLEELDLEKRGYLILDLLSKELEISTLEKKIEEKVKAKINQSQKNYFLKEKMNVIKDELGESGEDDIKELETAIKKAKLPKEVLKKVQNELKKLSKMQMFSAESSVSRTFIETVISLPWNKESKDILDIKSSEEVLDRDHYGLKDIKDKILDYLAVKQLNPNMKGGILCLAGPPGVGKTSLVKSIAESMGRSFVRVSLGGVKDESEIRGHRRTYVGSMPGRIIKALKEAGTTNPVILLDEIDKMSSDFKGDPASAMLEVLDPEQNYHFEDHYLDMPFDLSKVFFVATANDLRGVSGPLRDRMDIVTVSSYTEFEKMNIAKRYLIPQTVKENGVSNYPLEFSDKAVLKIIDEYTREAGVRNLKREINTIFRKIAREIIEKDRKKINITVANIEKYLGRSKFRPDKMREKITKVGVVNGLAWTSVGGTTLEVQGVQLAGKGLLTLTGTLGNVMKESATVAYTFIKSHTEDLKIENTDFFEKKDIHLHFPDGATPKDGPSAGIAIATTLLSVITNRKIRQDMAMTGEITITGEVLAIGGVKEKVIGAHRVGIREVILPQDNIGDVEDVPAEIIKDMTIYYAAKYSDVEKLIFEK